MKIPPKNKYVFLPDNNREYKLIENKSIIPENIQERFEHWGCLMYSQLISNLISMVLVSKTKISEN